MRNAFLRAGLMHEFRFKVPENKTVPYLYPESAEFQEMPNVFATGFLVGLLEWVCIQTINPYLNWPNEQTVGTHIDVSHIAATPPGFEVIARAKLVAVDGRRLFFEIEAHDGVDLISKGKHERHIINKDTFDSKMREKASRTGT